MHLFSDFDLIIFDCDGVLLDSNTLKIEAMGTALKKVGVNSNELEKCKVFFAKNFGKSRFYHVDYFSKNILNLGFLAADSFKKTLLAYYSEQCKKLYLTAEVTPFAIDLLTKSNAIKYVASGSEQGELREVFNTRNLDSFFSAIFGSPEKKTVNIANVLKIHCSSKAVMIGDALSDLEAAKENNIDFIFYSPYSNVENDMRKLCQKLGYRIIDSFEEIIKEI